MTAAAAAARFAPGTCARTTRATTALCCLHTTRLRPLLPSPPPRRNNYFGTQSVMQLASGMTALRSFVHVSTYFVNNHAPRGSVVREQVHALPLELDGRRVGYAEFVEALMAMDTETSNNVALELMGKHNFNRCAVGAGCGSRHACSGCSHSSCQARRRQSQARHTAISDGVCCVLCCLSPPDTMCLCAARTPLAST